MKWYDYVLCVWFAFNIWASWLVGDFFGVLLNYGFYFLYEMIRKNEVQSQ